jgi:hypothetical protein
MDFKGHIYFIQNEFDGLIKMGHTKRKVQVRYDEWQRLTPHPLRLLGFIEASVYEERYLKNILFYPYMMPTCTSKGESEWFRPAALIMRYIEEKCVIIQPTFIAKTVLNTCN